MATEQRSTIAFAGGAGITGLPVATAAGEPVVFEQLAAGAGVPLFIQPTAPVGVVGAYQWIQTGLGPLGADQTIWIEDGL